MIEAYAALAHSLNLWWGVSTKTVVSSKSWSELSEEEKIEKVETFKRLSSELNASVFKPKDLHNLWLETAPPDHPCNKPYHELDAAEQGKDDVYFFVLKLWRTYRLSKFVKELAMQEENRDGVGG